MSKLNTTPNQNALDKVLNSVNGDKPSTKEDVISMLTKQTKSKDIIPNSKPKKRKRGLPTKQEVEQIPEINHTKDTPEIPEGFPEGTIMNDDQTLTLPDGRVIRKKAGVDYEETI